MSTAQAYGAQSATSPISPLNIERRAVGATDVQIEILFCGICHSDLHTARGEWPGTVYPVIPGHEIVGKVTGVGNQVKKFKVGDLAGVGCLVDSCRECQSCKQSEEQFCDTGGMVFTYNSPDKHLPGKTTYGGYSTQIVVDQDFVLSISPKLDLAAVAPLLCAGITTYSPLKHWGVKKGDKVGIVGLGGLGHMGLKFAHAFGAHTVLFTTSPGKTEDALRLGANEVVISKDEKQMAKHANSFDFILNTVAASHNLNVMNLIFRRRSIAGSLIGGIKETQEMLDFCAANNIVSDIEKINASQINEAYERMLKSDVKYRFVIDNSTMKN